MNKSIKEQMEEIEPIQRGEMPKVFQDLYNEDLEWARSFSGISEDLLGKELNA